MALIDFHNHYYPPRYLDEIRKGPSAHKVTVDMQGNPVLHSPGDFNVAVRGHRDIAYREEVLDQAGIDRQVLTFTAPGTSIETPERSAQLASLVNDCLAEVAAAGGSRFSALGTLPLNAPQAAVSELERAVEELGFKGFMLYSNANGAALADRRFWPLYERANDLRLVLYIHPTYPLGVEAMQDYMLMPLVGFTADTTLAAAHLVFAGVPERFPDIRWVLAHLGGAVPYLAERLDRGFHAFAACRKNIDRPPSHYLKTFYYDTVNFDPAALRLALQFAGEDRLVAGSDYPHMIGSLQKMIESIDSLALEPPARQKILGGNAARLLGL